MSTPPQIEVAVGVVRRADGRVLLAQRPSGKVMAGYWEFPGGKIEPGESPWDALARELHEELSIDIRTAQPWLTRTFHYPHAVARLQLFRVTEWLGEPHGREDQQLSWQDPHRIDIVPLLPANHDIMDALRLPSLYAITQAGILGVDVFMERLQAALQNGVRLVQVREKDMDAASLRRFTENVIGLCHAHEARVLVNSDVGLAIDTGADGVHLQTAQFMTRNSPPVTGMLWAASCHNREELLQAVRLGAEFAVLSPVLPTQSHPGAPVLGWEGFAAACRHLPMPVYALGGMKIDLLQTAIGHNAHGIAMLSGIW
ncbi:MAG: Nudix family hydrolase [Gammaproteobacteria bacterium]|nr:MAG: Nudix family hydrolase [Gammaproteobacteria bacterium]